MTVSTPRFYGSILALNWNEIIPSVAWNASHFIKHNKDSIIKSNRICTQHVSYTSHNETLTLVDNQNIISSTSWLSTMDK